MRTKRREQDYYSEIMVLKSRSLLVGTEPSLQPEPDDSSLAVCDGLGAPQSLWSDWGVDSAGCRPAAS